jgi:hypothetical protein
MTSYPLKMSIFYQRKQLFFFLSQWKGPDKPLHRETVTSATATEEGSEKGLQFHLPVNITSFIMKRQRHMPEETG